MTFEEYREGPSGQMQFAKIAGLIPDRSRFSVSGPLTSFDHEFDIGETLMVMITTADGQVVASQHCEVASVGAAQKRDKDGFVVERARTHKLKA